MEARDYRSLLVDASDGVATLTMNVPERKNPLGPAMVNELLYALDDAKDDDAVRVVVLTGAGNAFSAGGDLKQMRAGEGLAPKGDFLDLLLRFRDLGKPTIARVPGHCYGGGLGIVAACDFAIACESAKLGTPEVKRGIFPMMIMALLQNLVPRRELMRMMLVGERMSATEAQRVGLVGEVVPDDALDAATAELAATLAAQSPTAIRMGLRAFHRQAALPLDEALPYLREQLFAILGTEDAREGLKAFVEKREPVWTGR
ncbi:MAG: enoyl-CoA hydratase-related protein [Myxococcota bacterium]